MNKTKKYQIAAAAVLALALAGCKNQDTADLEKMASPDIAAEAGTELAAPEYLDETKSTEADGTEFVIENDTERIAADDTELSSGEHRVPDTDIMLMRYDDEMLNQDAAYGEALSYMKEVLGQEATGTAQPKGCANIDCFAGIVPFGEYKIEYHMTEEESICYIKDAENEVVEIFCAPAKH